MLPGAITDGNSFDRVQEVGASVRRNIVRFPEDFMFEITPDEIEALRSQNVILNTAGRGKHSKYPLYAFTQEGIAMLSSLSALRGRLNAAVYHQLVPVKLCC